jgi:hypothetical protein
MGDLKSGDNPVKEEDDPSQQTEEETLLVSQPYPNQITSSDFTEASQHKERQRPGDFHIRLLSTDQKNLGNIE